MTSFKNYNIIDYDHNYTFHGKWYKKNLGTPIKLWQSKEETTYIDVFDVQRTVPKGTWWLRSMITNPEAIQEIDNKTLNSYSLTTANKKFANNFINDNTQVSTKNDDTNRGYLLIKHNMAVKSRTLIKDIKDPVAFTVSLTGFPCVGGAVFAKKCLEASQTSNKHGDDNMTEGINLSFDNLKELLSLKNKKDEEDVYVTKEELQETLNEHEKSLSESIGNVIDEKLATIQDDGKDDDKKGEGEGSSGEGEGAGKEGDSDNASGEGQGEGASGEGEGEGQTSTKHNPGTKQLEHKDDGDDQSFKRGTTEYSILSKLGRNGNGTTKIRL